jgi:glutathione S-transferase
MAELKIYGAPASRALRCLWIANELGLDYECVPLKPREEATRATPFLSVNPNAKVPAIDDGGLKLYESMAINLYLARKHGGDLAPADIAEEGQALQWSFWVVTEIETPILTALFNLVMRPEGERDAEAAQKSIDSMQKPLAVLDAALAGKEYLMGGRFTVADLNVSSVLAWGKIFRLDLSAYPNVAAWLDRCLGRPAYKAARG